MRRWKGEAAVCAEPLAVLALFAVLADIRPDGMEAGGFTLDRNWDSIPGALDRMHPDLDEGKGGRKKKDVGEGDKWALDQPNGQQNTAIAGTLKFYLDITN